MGRNRRVSEEEFDPVREAAKRRRKYKSRRRAARKTEYTKLTKKQIREINSKRTT